MASAKADIIFAQDTVAQDCRHTALQNTGKRFVIRVAGDYACKNKARNAMA